MFEACYIFSWRKIEIKLPEEFIKIFIKGLFFKFKIKSSINFAQIKKKKISLTTRNIKFMYS